MRGVSGTPIPHVDNERRGSGNGPVIPYTLSPEELEKYRAMPNPNAKPVAKTYSLTKEQYLKERAGGKNRRDIVLQHVGNNAVAFKGFLEAWGLADPASERAAIEAITGPKLPVIKAAEETRKKVGRTAGNAPVSKEFVQGEFEKGKTVRQIETENGMKQGTLFYWLKKWDIRSPHGPNYSKSQNRSSKPAAAITISKVVTEQAVVFTPEEIQILKVFRSAIDKVVVLYGQR